MIKKCSRILAVLAAAVMCAGALCGCDSFVLPPQGGTDASAPVSTATTTLAPTTTTATAPTQPEITPAQLALEAAAAKTKADGSAVGVAYLGWCEDDLAGIKAYLREQGLTQECLYLELVDENSFVAAPGGELYVLVPAHKDVSIIINEYSWMDVQGEYAPAAGSELLTSTGGAPVLLRCNASDIMSNLQVTADDGSGQAVVFHPALSLEDGMLDMLSGGVCDLTPYDAMPQFNYVDPAPASVFCGSWSCLDRDGSGTEQVMTLVLEPEGGAEFSFGLPDAPVTAVYTGFWQDNGTMLTLSMSGGIPDENGEVPAGSGITVYLSWYATHEGLELTHTAGSPLLPGTEKETFVFRSVD